MHICKLQWVEVRTCTSEIGSPHINKHASPAMFCVPLTGISENLYYCEKSDVGVKGLSAVMGTSLAAAPHRPGSGSHDPNYINHLYVAGMSGPDVILSATVNVHGKKDPLTTRTGQGALLVGAVPADKVVHLHLGDQKTRLADYATMKVASLPKTITMLSKYRVTGSRDGAGNVRFDVVTSLGPSSGGGSLPGPAVIPAQFTPEGKPGSLPGPAVIPAQFTPEGKPGSLPGPAVIPAQFTPEGVPGSLPGVPMVPGRR